MPRAPRMDGFSPILTFAALLVGSSTRAVAIECFDYSTSPHWISTTSIRSAHTVAVQEGYAYVSTYDSLFVVVDVRDITSPSIVAQLHLDHTPGDIELAGDFLYLANDDGGLAIFDISTPSSPTLISQTDTPGAAFEIDRVGNYVYVADFSAGVQVIDVADPGNPAIVATLSTPGFAYAVEARDTEILIGHGHGLMIADISDPLAPWALGNLPMARVVSVAWMGDVAGVAAEAAGFFTIDVSDPTSPAILGQVPVPYSTWAAGVMMDGTTAFVSVIWDGIWGIDCSHPGGPKTQFEISPASNSGSCVMAGDQLFAAEDFVGLQIFDLGDRATPPPGGGTVLPHFGGVRLRVSAAYAFGLAQNGWFEVFDVQDPGAPVHVASLPVSDWAYDFTVARDMAYVALAAPGHGTRGGIEIIDLSAPTVPKEVSKLPFPQRVLAVAKGPGRFLYFVAQRNFSSPYRLCTVDVGDPAAPQIVGSIPIESGAWALEYALGHLYILGGTGLLVADLSDPAAPLLVGELAAGIRRSMAFHLPSAGTGGQPYAYLAGQSDLAVADLSTPSHPVLVTNVPMVPFASPLVIEGNALYASHFDGFAVYDLRPDFPSLTGGSAVPVSLGFYDLAVHPPTGDLLVSSYLTLERWPGHCGGPSRMSESQAPQAIAAPSMTLSHPQPNPFRSSDAMVSLAYTLRQAGSVRLAIVDAVGRCVRELADGSQPAGTQVVGWDGRNERGAQVASGVYFIRLDSGGETRTERLLRLR